MRYQIATHSKWISEEETFLSTVYLVLVIGYEILLVFSHHHECCYGLLFVAHGQTEPVGILVSQSNRFKVFSELVTTAMATV